MVAYHKFPSARTYMHYVQVRGIDVHDVGVWALRLPCSAARSRSVRDGRLNSDDLRSRGTLCRLTTMGKVDRDVRMSLQTLRVLEVFLENHTEQLSGAEVHQCCGLASGTLYPILLRLESAGWFASRWESIDPSTVGRPRRRLYRLTSAGLRRASEIFASFSRGVLT
jgi:PadR family transcriptional regulator PadR